MLGPVAVQVRATVTVREVANADELRACQALQRRAWGITEDGYVVPVATMAAAQRVGGLVLGAFNPDDTLVGFSFSFLGRVRGRLVLYSQLTGVDPEYQGSGIGRAIKLEQRARAAEIGVQAIAWAFDPLQASNAAFNLSVLGAECRTYEVDMYGARTDALNAGLATDRLLAEWSTSAEPRRVTWTDAAPLIETIPHGELRRPSGVNAARERRLTLEIPADLRETKRAGIATEWQHAVRQAFTDAFARGYVAVGFSRADPTRPRYLLERQP